MNSSHRSIHIKARRPSACYNEDSAIDVASFNSSWAGPDNMKAFSSPVTTADKIGGAINVLAVVPVSSNQVLTRIDPGIHNTSTTGSDDLDVPVRTTLTPREILVGRLISMEGDLMKQWTFEHRAIQRLLVRGEDEGITPDLIRGLATRHGTEAVDKKIKKKVAPSFCKICLEEKPTTKSIR
jgi:hypothetical protein